MIITSANLVKAFHDGCRLDASDYLVGPLSGSPRRHRSALFKAGLIPPFLQAAYQAQAFGKPSSRALLDYRGFEELSLLARTVLLSERVLGRVKRQAGPSPNDDKAFNAIKALKGPRFDIFASMPCVDGQMLVKHLLAFAADDINGAEPWRRVGFQLVGCRITGQAPLNLSNATLPFPLSFIGCVFEAPLLVNHAEIVSLDLSASGLLGLEARGLQARGGVHFRRATIVSPVSLSGARIGGLLDGSDALVTAMTPAPAMVMDDATHGVLNLSKAEIENEVSLERIRVWGGLSLRGMQAGRSIFLNGAVIASPIGVLEKWAFDTCSAGARIKRTVGSPARSLVAAEDVARRKTHDPFLPRGEHLARTLTKACRATHQLVIMETAMDAAASWADGALTGMLQESLRARSHAIRADGLVVRGNIFAEHLHALGNIRLKGADIDGSIRLAGSVLRSGEVSRTYLNQFTGLLIDTVHSVPSLPALSLEQIKVLRYIAKLRKSTGGVIDTPRHFLPQDFALDIREARIGADISFAPGEQTPGGHKHNALLRRDPWHSLDAEVHGVITAAGASIGGSFNAARVLFCWAPTAITRHRQDPSKRGRQPGLEKADIALAQKDMVKDVRARSRLGEFTEIPDDHHALERFGVCLRQARVGMDVSFLASRGLWGLDLEEARIEGRVQFSRRHSGRDIRDDLRVKLEGRAQEISGVLLLKGARVGADCSLVFDPDRGPDIRATNAEFDGRLNIYPSLLAERHVSKARLAREAEDLAQRRRHLGTLVDTAAREDAEHEIEKLGAHYRDSFLWTACAHRLPGRFRSWWSGSPPGLTCEDCGEVLTRRWFDRPSIDGHFAGEWHIDLRDARAELLCHPPSAWPHPGALSLDGFRYVRGSSLGPLTPMLVDELLHKDGDRPLVDPPAGPSGGSALPASGQAGGAQARRGFSIQAVGPGVATLVLLGLWGLLILPGPPKPLLQVVLGILLIVLLSVTDWRALVAARARFGAPQRLDPGDRRSHGRLLLAAIWPASAFLGAILLVLTGIPGLDWMELGFRVTVTGSLALIATSSWLNRFHIQSLFGRHPGGISPRSAQMRSLALEYLARQRTEYNRFQALTSRYRPNESYRTAAQALREAGRYITANEVEEERLRQRQRLLSWRRHFLSKLFLQVADWTSGFGFKLDRLCITLVLSVLGIAVLAHASADVGLIHAKGAKATLESCANRSRRSKPEQRCPGLLYAIDLIFPVDLGTGTFELDEAKLAKALPPLPASPQTTPAQVARATAWGILRSFDKMAALLGGLLISFVAAAIGSRAEAAFHKVEE